MVGKTLVDVISSVQELLSMYDSKIKVLNERRNSQTNLAQVPNILSILPNACKNLGVDTQFSNPTTTTQNKTAMESKLPANFLNKAELIATCQASRQIRQQLIQDEKFAIFDEQDAEVSNLIRENSQPTQSGT